MNSLRELNNWFNHLVEYDGWGNSHLYISDNVDRLTVGKSVDQDEVPSAKQLIQPNG
jgi:hypothetical protein